MTTTPSTDARFRRIYDRNYLDVRDYCIRRLGADDANDAAAEVFTVAWRRIDDVPEGHQARLWLFGVARNVIAHQYRSRARHDRIREKLERTRETTPRRSVEATVEARSQRAAVLDALDQLKPDAREVVRLRMWEGLTHAEVGQVLGISAHAAEMRLARAAKKLAHILERSPALHPLPLAGGEP